MKCKMRGAYNEVYRVNGAASAVQRRDLPEKQFLEIT